MLLIRHAESEWNRVFGPSRVDAGIHDPSITAAAREATRACAADLRAHGLARIVASPYRRTLQTATVIGRELALPITIDARVRERCAFSCDQGTPGSSLAAAWPELDASGLEERWWGRLIESMDSLAGRARQFLGDAAGWPDRNRVLVVSHWGFIRCVTGREVHNLTAVRVAFAPDGSHRAS